MLPLASFGNLFSGDGIIIFLILLLLFGAKKLPELAKGLGSAVREFSKAKDEIHHEMTRAATPQTPQIAAPKYTEAHTPLVDQYGHPLDEHGHPTYHSEDHGYVTPPDPAPAPVVASATTAPSAVSGSAEVHAVPTTVPAPEPEKVPSHVA